MTTLTLQAGEYMWTEDGKHVIGPNGFAVRCEEECQVEMQDQETYDRVFAIVDAERIKNTVVPEPEPEFTEPEPEEEPEV